MKNNIFIFYFFLALFFITNVFSKNLEINSSEIKIDKKESKIIFKGNIEAIDDNRNILKADEANYFNCIGRALKAKNTPEAGTVEAFVIIN